MTQTQPIDAYLGPAQSGAAIGATIYQLDGSTSYAAFSTSGWYEAPSSSGHWHHAGVTLPDAGGVVAVGTSGTEVQRVAIGAELATAANLATVDTVVDGIKAVTDNLPDSGALTTIDANVDAILDDTGTSGVQVADKTGYSLAADQSGVTVGTVNALGTTAKADVNAEVDTALSGVGLTSTVTGRIDAAISTRSSHDAAAVVAALFAEELESGKTVQEAWLDIWAAIVGDAASDDASNPTSITYDSPDGTVQITHTLTTTTRTTS